MKKKAKIFWQQLRNFFAKKSQNSHLEKKELRGILKKKKRIFFGIGIVIVLGFSFLFVIFFREIVEFLEKFIIFQKIEIWKLLAGIGVAFSLFVAFRRLKIADKNLVNETKQIESDQFSRQNQQFLDAVKIFDESKTLESKKGALFHLENLALSSPAHRQRVLDFLNSLNGWMREKKDELKNADFGAWRNEKKLLLNTEIVLKETQFLSAEIPKIYENIIRKHNEEFPSFSPEKQKEYTLDFSYFVFAEINFRKFVFPKEETRFRNCIFFGDSNFCEAQFLGEVSFSEARLSKGVDFSKAQFSGDTDFSEIQFLGEANFSEAYFLGFTSFSEAYFSREASFFCSTFLNRAVFYKTKFLGLTNFFDVIFSEAVFEKATFYKITSFQNITFSEHINFKRTNFQKCHIKIQYPLEFEKKDNFLSLENFKKFRSAGAIFSEEQIAYFENLEKESGKP